MKNQFSDSAYFKMPKEKSKYDRQIFEFRTEYLINNPNEMAKNSNSNTNTNTPSIKSIKKINCSTDNDEFTPYMRQLGNLKSDNQ